MNILAVETTGTAASAAIIKEDGQVFSRRSERTLSHLQNLIPMIGELLEDCNLKPEELTAIAVSEGPGSFTGIRIGVATVRALSQALGLPCISVPTLRSFAYNYKNSEDLLCPVLDARRNQVFAGAYYWENGICVQAVSDKAYDPEEFTALAEAEARELGKKVRILEEGEQSAAAVSALALDLWKSGKTLGFEELRPVYLRQAEAERKLQERLAREAELQTSGRDTGEEAGAAGGLKEQKMQNDGGAKA